MMSSIALPFELKQFRSMHVLTHLMFFQAGVVAYTLTHRIRIGSPALTFVLTLAAFVLNERWGLVRSDVLFAVVAAIWILCAVAGLPPLMDNAVSRFFGRISYGTYLVHFFVLILIDRAGGFALIRTHEYAFLLGCIATLPFVICVGTLVYHLIESPGIALGERFLGGNRPTVLAAKNP
jgi:peptidoglycan/LPS O-acetylase OafA/YrhL